MEFKLIKNTIQALPYSSHPQGIKAYAMSLTWLSDSGWELEVFSTELSSTSSADPESVVEASSNLSVVGLSGVTAVLSSFEWVSTKLFRSSMLGKVTLKDKGVGSGIVDG